jgi:hypothetical protein
MAIRSNWQRILIPAKDIKERRQQMLGNLTIGYLNLWGIKNRASAYSVGGKKCGPCHHKL